MQKRSASGRARYASEYSRLSFIEPDRQGFVDPFDNRKLIQYFRKIGDWHGYIRFLGLPFLRDDADVAIDQLFVEPRISLRQVDPSNIRIRPWETFEVGEVLSRSPRCILLGDPGSGKSTLLNWIAYRLTRPEESELTEKFGRLVPLPMILREMDLTSEITWPRLLASFLAHSVAAPLGGSTVLNELLARGQAIIMIDGLDEVGNLAVRKALRDAVHDGILRHPKCRWLLTSRIIGFDDVPFGSIEEVKGIHRAFHEKPIDASVAQPDFFETKRIPIADVRYVVPFDDEQIKRFARDWYLRHERDPEQASEKANDFVAAINKDDGTRQLARIPNLLTMMALIHRTQANLPHGRALLYEKIAIAYLDALETFKGLNQDGYSLTQKKAWLSYVAFKMQSRRRDQSSETDETASNLKEILVDEQDVETWLAEAMRGTTGVDPVSAARAFLDYIGRRSGLLLPRGAGRFAFIHLSFQEYFAACHILDKVTSPQWIRGRAVGEGLSAAELSWSANDSAWKQTLLFLFELLGDKPDWTEELCEKVFGPNFRLLAEREPKSTPMAQLLASLIVDPHAISLRELRREAAVACWNWLLDGQRERGIQGATSSALLSTELAEVREAFELVASERVKAVPQLRLENGRRSDVLALSKLRGLVHLHLHGFRGFESIDDLLRLESLRTLCLLGCRDFNNIRSIAKFRSLREFYPFDCDKLRDIAPLSQLGELQALGLAGTAVTDISALRNLSSLEWLSLAGCDIDDLSPLKELRKLKHIDLRDCSGAHSLPVAVKRIKGIKIEGLDSVSTA